MLRNDWLKTFEQKTEEIIKKIVETSYKRVWEIRLKVRKKWEFTLSSIIINRKYKQKISFFK